MSMTSVRSNPEVRLFDSRIASGMMFLLFVMETSLMSNTWWFHPGDGRRPIALVMFLLLAFLWVFHTIRCLSRISISKYWILPVIVPLALYTLSLFKHWSFAAWTSLVVALTVQLLLSSMQPRDKNLTGPRTDGSAGLSS
jgi:hypothetical protein